MANRVQIVLEAEDAASGVLRGITSQLGSFGNVLSGVGDVVSKNEALFSLYQKGLDDTSVSIAQVARAEEEASMASARLAETIATFLIETLKDAHKEYTEYASAIRDLSLVSGQGAEDTSRFVQVLDDFELSAEDATTAARFLKEKGLSPNIDTLARLADEFKKIEDPAERLVFAQENLGRSSAKWLNILSQESDELRERAGNINESLILTDEQIKLFEVQRLALDDVQDGWKGFQVQLGSAFGNIVAYNKAQIRVNVIRATA